MWIARVDRPFGYCYVASFRKAESATALLGCVVLSIASWAPGSAFFRFDAVKQQAIVFLYSINVAPSCEDWAGARSGPAQCLGCISSTTGKRLSPIGTIVAAVTTNHGSCGEGLSRHTASRLHAGKDRAAIVGTVAALALRCALAVGYALVLVDPGGTHGVKSMRPAVGGGGYRAVTGGALG